MEDSRTLLLLWNPVIEMCLNIHICMFIKFSIHGTLEVLDIFVTPFITLSWLVLLSDKIKQIISKEKPIHWFGKEPEDHGQRRPKCRGSNNSSQNWVDTL